MLSLRRSRHVMVKITRFRSPVNCVRSLTLANETHKEKKKELRLPFDASQLIEFAQLKKCISGGRALGTPLCSGVPNGSSSRKSFFTVGKLVQRQDDIQSIHRYRAMAIVLVSCHHRRRCCRHHPRPQEGRGEEKVQKWKL